MSALIAKHAQQMLSQSTEISYAEFCVLMALSCKDCLMPHEIAERMGHSNAAISRQMKALEKQGFVKKTPTKDRRASPFMLTEEGRKVALKSRHILQEYWKDACRELTDSEIEVATRINQKLIDRLSRD